ncbi:mitochondrial ribonuclease P catalytic subunit isoform X2 [Trichomycterus rosablanca]
MGSLVVTNSRICIRYLCPLIRRPLNHQCTQQTPKRLNIQQYCTKNDRNPPNFTPRARTSFPRSVFAAGHAKRTAELMKRKSGADQDQDASLGSERGRAALREEIPDHPLSVSEWRNLKENSSKQERFELKMMESMLSVGTDIDVAKSLLNFVAVESGTLPYELLLRFLTLCVSGGHRAEVSDVYDIMRGCYKTLDTGAYSLLVKGLSQTERWRETLGILDQIKKVITPSSRNYGDAISGACLHGDRDTAWRLYRELMDQGLTASQETWRCLFESSDDQREDKDELMSVLNYMRENQIYPDERLAKSIKTWFESEPDEKWRGTFSSVDLRGVCRSCAADLESIRLTEEEYAQLKHRVVQDVIEGRDVFNKTTPEELESFKNFAKNRAAFDVVIDGLNVANLNPKCTKSETLLAVVSELEQQGLNILVLGRKHMLHPSRNWDRHHMNQIKHKAHCFFTENISEDDPFLLYAALHSGNHCNFVSRDLMRDHKACLPDSATRRLFFKWQRGHQLVLNNYVPGKKVQFQRTSTYDTIVQGTGHSWHIPYDEDGGERSTYEVPQRWLCLNKEL